MLATKSYLYSKLSTDAGLLALVGSSDNIVDAWPEEILTFPIVIYQDDNQSDGEYADNKPTMSRIRYKIDIFSKIDGVTNSEIGLQVARFFRDEFFNCGTNGEMQDVTEGVRHRVMRFSRELFTSDII
jgi:hypothetical protein